MPVSEENIQQQLESVFGIPTTECEKEGQSQFQEDHLIADKAGIGDLRTAVEFHLNKGDRSSLHVGIYATIPTAFAFKKGLKGSSFKKKFKRPTISFIELIDQTGFINSDRKDLEALQATLEKFFLGALDTLSANLLEDDLGNNRHSGLGISFRTQTHIGDYLTREFGEAFTFNNYFSIEYLFQSREKRCFVDVNNPEDFEINLEELENDETKAAQTLKFFEEQFVNKFYPFVIDTKVKPGFIFEWVTHLNFESEHLGIAFGHDIWVRSQEDLSDLDFCNHKGDHLNPKIFAVERARAPHSFQAKILGSFFMKAPRPTRTWIIGLNADWTYVRSGIGKDWTVTLDMEVHF